MSNNSFGIKNKLSTKDKFAHFQKLPFEKIHDCMGWVSQTHHVRMNLISPCLEQFLPSHFQYQLIRMELEATRSHRCIAVIFSEKCKQTTWLGSRRPNPCTGGFNKEIKFSNLNH